MYAFGLVGVAGFVAKRHLQAIKQTNNTLLVAIDTNDCVGILDSYFPDARFFLSLESFSAFLQNQSINNQSQPLDFQSPIDFLSIVTPNFLHKSHCEFALKHGMNAICEKPLVLSAQDARELLALEKNSNKKIWTILQLRLHPNIIALKKRVDSILAQNSAHIFDIELTYITARGSWFFVSWKGDEAKSGGLACNIGIHFFDMLQYIFGAVEKNILHYKSRETMSGFLQCKHAQISWFLSVSSNFLPENPQARTYRCMRVDSEEVDFSSGFEDLHTQSYRQILEGKGFGIESSLPSIKIVETLRSIPPSKEGRIHPLCEKLKGA
ncbi:oxidoreductase [Helicobacter sp. MIT 00-7814]|uniref:Gfo/Idh/MocA family oxidoreductase n=1 Tax=unclassified Helicobacter TaxID=2593540 RepID=UPI000E1EC386|nr:MULTISPECIES: Gfo/Idh/MocA family oxidoreductase [unclassified Helicobacter]RDU54226.1 oxidoreductase [Helicobacter sp. MIT 00-7814]RDU56028.1 oxidoreductase [Helicobacter sp. MIT 99-10781]